MKKFELHLDITDGNQSITDLLSAECALSKAEIKQAIDKGALWHSKGKRTQRLRRIKKPLNVGEQLHFYFDEKILKEVPVPAELIHDATSYSVWYKPYGMLSQGSKWSDHCTISRFAEKALTRNSFIVHRLDRAASGLIIIAHSKKMAQTFSKYFEQHLLKKRYQIIVHGNFEAKHAHETKIETSLIDDKSAQSSFTFQQYSSNLDMSLLNVDIASGRKHQIRIHSARLGFPVVGDRLHGDHSVQYAATLNLQLAAVSLSFTCPLTQAPITIDLPSQLRPSLDKIAPQTT